MRTQVYIDGFNLYYGSVKNTPYKWLNVKRMCELLLPSQCKIVGIKYFTAKVHSSKKDPQKHIRQLVYLRALKTLPNLEIVYGRFLRNRTWMPLTKPGKNHYVEVWKTEEKGSDVNLAVHLLKDGYQGNYDLAVLVTNDSDLLSAVKIVRHDLRLRVGLLNPQKEPSKVLYTEVNFIRQIRKNVLQLSQFPTQMKDSKGKFIKPTDW